MRDSADIFGTLRHQSYKPFLESIKPGMILFRKDTYTAKAHCSWKNAVVLEFAYSLDFHTAGIQTKVLLPEFGRTCCFSLGLDNFVEWITTTPPKG
jgi:hypothetical protein